MMATSWACPLGPWRPRRRASEAEALHVKARLKRALARTGREAIRSELATAHRERARRARGCLANRIRDGGIGLLYLE